MPVNNRGSLRVARKQEKGDLIQVEGGDEHTWEGFSEEAMCGCFLETGNG